MEYKYTKDKPTEPGWYWVRSSIGDHVWERIEFIDSDEPYLLNTEWAGPLSSPEGG